MARGACQRGEAQGEAAQVLAGPVLRLPFFLHRAKELAHGPVKTVGKPRAAQRRAGDALRGDQRHFLRVQVRSRAAGRPERPGNERRVLLAKAGVSTEEQRRLPRIVLDDGL